MRPPGIQNTIAVISLSIYNHMTNGGLPGLMRTGQLSRGRASGPHKCVNEHPEHRKNEKPRSNRTGRVFLRAGARPRPGPDVRNTVYGNPVGDPHISRLCDKEGERAM